ncbi:MAG: arginine--tRNA ligase [Ruminococcaceae bacterium]|nr:arginine--tRNA ligase [Oscillospiraceae bacterium]
MLNFKNTLSQALSCAIKKISPESELSASELFSMLEYPPNRDMGDIAFPCFKLSKSLRKAPPVIASLLSEAMDKVEYLAKAEVAGGYLNFFIDDSYFTDGILDKVISEGDDYGKSDSGKGKTLVIDYSSPNVAKPFHIGHLGTTVIGHSLKKLHEFCGWNAIGINHLGDWGTQFGKLIVAYKLWGNKEQIEEGGIDKLVELYVRINNTIKGDPENGIPARDDLADQSRAEFHKMEIGDEENIALWKWFIEISLNEYEKTYKQLGITFDSYAGESFYTDLMPAQVQRLRDKDLLKIDDGASIVDLSEYNMPPCLILKRDGSTLYPTRDIAAAVYRKEHYNFDKCVYVTSNQQILHFQQWFKVLELMGYEWYGELVHIPYGTVSIGGMKLATRTGNVILLKDLFKMAVEKVKAIMEEKNPDLENKDEVAEAVGIGAIVFYYLTNSRIKDNDFSLEDALSFEGNTGPYAQYTYARCCSIIEKAGGVPEKSLTSGYEPQAAEAALCRVLSLFTEKVNDAITDSEPMVITRYILDICAAFNRFYHDCPILSANEDNARAFRVRLTEATKTVLGNAFGLICLKKTPKI